MLSLGGVITIADPDWQNPRDVAVGDLAVGWRVNGVGRGSVRLPAWQAHRLGWTDVKGCWLLALLGPLGSWGGIIEDDPGDIGSGIVELSAADFGVTLDHAITARTYRQITSSPGGLIGRNLRDAALDGPLWFTDVSIDESGAAITVEERGEQVGRVISSIASGAGGAWNVTTDGFDAITFTYRSEYDDKRSSLILWEGYNVVAGSIRPSVSRIVNDLLGIANDRDWQRAAAARVEGGRSIIAYGRRQGSQRYPGHTRASSIETVARADLERLALPSHAISVEVPITDPSLREIREGQLVTLVSATTNKRLDFEIAARAYTALNRTVTLVGSAWEQAA